MKVEAAPQGFNYDFRSICFFEIDSDGDINVFASDKSSIQRKTPDSIYTAYQRALAGDCKIYVAFPENTSHKGNNGKPARRKVLPLEELMDPIMRAIRIYYLPADGNAMWDSEEKEYINEVQDEVDLVYNLDGYMECTDSELLNAIADIINADLFVDAQQIMETPEDQDLSFWQEYCGLVNARKDLSVEQIVSLCTRAEVPEDLQKIRQCLDMVLSYAKEMHLFFLP